MAKRYGDIELQSGAKVTGGALPTAASDLTTKEYVDSQAAGLDPKESCRVATTADLDTVGNGTWVFVSNSPKGVGTTLTAGSVGTTTIDTIVLGEGDRVLVKDQGTALENGIYQASGTGGGVLTVLTRAGDQDGTPSSEVSGGNFTFIELGTTNSGKGFTVVADGEVDIDIDNMNWTAVSSPGGGLNNVVEDTTPQLGGDLDANGNDILLTAASAASPSLKFNGMTTDQGFFYNSAQDGISYAYNGSEYWRFDATYLTAVSGGRIQATAGSVSFPSITFNEVDNGFYGDGGRIRVSNAGSQTFQFEATRHFSLIDGSAGTPAYSWAGDLTTGIYHSSNEIAFSTSGTKRLGITNTGLNIPNSALPTDSPIDNVLYATTGDLYWNGTQLNGGGGGGSPMGIAAVIDDTSPQLGGNLDVNSFTITGLTDTPAVDSEAASKKYVDDSLSTAVGTATSAAVFVNSAIQNTNLTTGNPIVLDTDYFTKGTKITRSGNVITLQPGSYKLRGSLGRAIFSDANGICTTIFVNTTGSPHTQVGTTGIFVPTTRTTAGNFEEEASAYVTVATVSTFELQFINTIGSALSEIGSSGSVTGVRVEVEEIADVALGGGGASVFTDLTDTPSAPLTPGKYLQVGTGSPIALVEASLPYDISGSVIGVPTVGTIVYRFAVTRSVGITSVGFAYNDPSTPATVSPGTFELHVVGPGGGPFTPGVPGPTGIATVTFAPGAPPHAGVVTFPGGPVSVGPPDELLLVYAAADGGGTLGNISFTFEGVTP